MRSPGPRGATRPISVFALATLLAACDAGSTPTPTATMPTPASGADASAENASVADRAVLVALYEATDGPNWTNSENWLTDKPIGEWYGVYVDGQGRTISLWLPSNNLKGSIPSELGDLGSLRRLMLGSNPLGGRIPPELGRLGNLEELHLIDNKLTGPIPPELGDLGSLEYLGLSYNDLSGSIPPELGNLSSLRRLWLWATGLSGLIPPELGNLGNLESLTLGDSKLSGRIPPWIGDLANLRSLSLAQNELTGPIPPELRRLSNLVSLRLSYNRLTGTIPPWLGEMETLEHLSLSGNELTGPIPAELANLDRLKGLLLGHNGLSGPIPPELGDLANLTLLWLYGNSLSGPIPSELGRLANLSLLDLSSNQLSGSIPSGFGDLGNLSGLYLYENELTGPIPSELGRLGGLQDLFLANNDLDGGLPPSIGNLRELRRLQLSNNAALSGELPRELVSLGLLETLQADGTALCAPNDPDFQAWLEGVRTRRIASCALTMPAYLTQAVQSGAFPVPLVAGEQALLRVFLTAGTDTDERLPAVRARFYRNGRASYVKYIPAGSHPIPTEVDEGDLSKSVNAMIPGRVIQPGLEMVLEIDPDTLLDPNLGVPRRIPEAGRLAVETLAMPLLDLTQIPFLWSERPDSAIIRQVDAMAADPENHELLWATRTLLPVGDLYVTAHEPVTTSSNDAHDLIGETRAIRTLEGGTGHYMGMMSGRVIGAAGGSLPGRQVEFLGALGLGHGARIRPQLRSAPCAMWRPRLDRFGFSLLRRLHRVLGLRVPRRG